MSLESLCLIHNQQGPASPALRTRQCSQRMAHWTRDGSEGGFQSNCWILPARMLESHRHQPGL